MSNLDLIINIKTSYYLFLYVLSKLVNQVQLKQMSRCWLWTQQKGSSKLVSKAEAKHENMHF